MADVFEYFPWRGDLSMQAAPICDVDRLILCELAYVDFDADVPRMLPELCGEVLEKYAQLSGQQKKKFFHLKQDERLLRELAASPRFRNCQVASCVSRSSCYWFSWCCYRKWPQGGSTSPSYNVYFFYSVIFL